MYFRVAMVMAVAAGMALFLSEATPRAVRGDERSETLPSTDDLLKRLLGDSPDGAEPKEPGEGGRVQQEDQPTAAEPGEDPLERAIRGMRSAGRRLAGRDVGTETRGIQEQVVRDLQEMIEQARQPQGQPSGQPQSDPQPEPQPSPEEQDPDSADEEPEPSQADGGGEERQDAEDSSEELRPGETHEAELERRRQVVREVWGHLPPALRERLLNVHGEKSLPRYDDLVRSYFEALAEEERRRE